MMKHRSSVTLIIVVAILSVAPHAAQRLDDFGSSLVGRAESAVWNAFFSLHARHPRRPDSRRADGHGRNAETAALASNRETKERGRAESPSAKAAQDNRAAARERKSAGTGPSFEVEARADALIARLPHGLPINSFAPLNLDLGRIDAEKKVIALQALKDAEVAFAPPARFLSGEAGLGREEARKLTRIVEHHVRLKEVREAVRRRGAEVGPRSEADEEKAAPERGPKAKAQARTVCPLPAPAAPAAPASVYVDAGMQGFEIDH